MTSSTLNDSPVEGGWRAKVVEVFGADLRSLAVFRVVLALLVLADLTNRASDLSAHYTDQGVMPRTNLLEHVLSQWSFSLNVMNGEPFFQVLLFGIAAVAAVGMLIGYRTRLMTIIVWVLILSIQFRNPLVGGADGPLLRLLLFWGMFLPLGAYWSVDRALKAASPRLSMRFLSIATLGLFMQIAFMYWFTAMLKSGPEWRTDGTALYYVLSLDQLSTPIGQYLLNFPTLLELLTFATILLEAFGPFLLFCPFFTGPVRTGAVLAFMSLHFGIWITMDIGIFPWISAFCMVCFLPTWFWERATKLYSAFQRRTNVLRRLRQASTRLIHAYRFSLWPRLSTLVGARRLPDLVPVGAASRDQLESQSVGMMPLTTILSTWRGDTQPATRSEQEKRDSNGAGSEPTMLRSSLATNLAALFFLLYIFCWNLSTVSSFTIPERLVPLGPFLGLDQHWGMFAPSPYKEDGWFVMPGTLRGGQQVDLMPVTRDDFRPQVVSWEKPQDVSDTFKNEHWRKYLEKLQGDEKFVDQRLYLGGYICREWNERHTGSEQLMTFKITYMLEMTLPNYQTPTTEKLVLSKHKCL